MKLVYQPLGTVTTRRYRIQTTNKKLSSSIILFGTTEQQEVSCIGCAKPLHTLHHRHDEKLEKYFLNSSLFLILKQVSQPVYKGVKGGAMDAAKQLAARRFAELKENQEVFMNTNPMVYDYSLGRTEARENPAQVKPFDEEQYKQNAASQRSRLETA